MAQGKSEDSNWENVFCGIHNGAIRNFENIHSTISDLTNYEHIFKKDGTNFKKLSQVSALSVGGMIILGPAFYLAAPSIGGAIGVLLGHSGAAATSSGLALLGGGSIASGGLGMAGGTALITATGAGLGGKQGFQVAGSYLNDAKFKLKKIKDGKGDNIILINGFLTEGKSTIEEWIPGISKRFLGNPWYKLDWEAQLESDFYKSFTPTNYGAYKTLLTKALKALKSKKGPVTIASLGVLKKLIANPWFVAQSKASMTSIILADIIARLDNNQKCILLGHSLGGRIAIDTAKILSTKSDSYLSELHLLGAAAAPIDDLEFSPLETQVEKYIFNYYSKKDNVLSYAFRFSNIGFKYAVGNHGIGRNKGKFVDVDVSKLVDNHSKYIPEFPSFIRHFAHRSNKYK